MLNKHNNAPQMRMCIFNAYLVMNATLLSAFGGHKFGGCQGFAEESIFSIWAISTAPEIRDPSAKMVVGVPLILCF